MPRGVRSQQATKPVTTRRCVTLAKINSYLSLPLADPPEADSVPRSDRRKTFEKELYNCKGRNLIFSDEALSKSFVRDPEGIAMLAEVIGEDWETIVVVGYRRFFQWLPSSIFQVSAVAMIPLGISCIPTRYVHSLKVF
jgi:hypothetical protein